VTITANWAWWTYFVVGDDVVSCGRIVDYDIAARQLRYLKPTKRDSKSNPHPPGTDEYTAWLYDPVDATYAHIWIDPQKSIVLSHEDSEFLQRRQKPPGFLELVDQDPKDYFGDEEMMASTYLPPIKR
jgi:hypothetical protein